MVAPMRMEPITARGRSRWGLRLSPPSCTACSKPSSEKMAPPALTASRTPFDPYGAKPSAGEVVRVEVGEDQHDDRERRDDDLPGRDGVVGLHEPAHAVEVDHDEQRHQTDGDQKAQRGQDDRAVDRVGQAVHVVGRVLDGRLGLDGRRAGGLKPGEPAERRAGESTEGVVGEAGGAAADREHAAQLRVHQGQQNDGEGADQPGDDGRRPADGGDEQRAEQPARADDGALGGEEQPDEAGVALESLVVLTRRCGADLGHGDTRLCIRDPSPA